MSELIRPFTFDDIDFALAQTIREGWDTTREEFELALEHDPHGGFIAEVEGESAALITTTRLQRTGWVGNLIVGPDYRRRGLGERMMQHALGYLEAAGDITAQLEADPMGIGIYRRLGFADRFQSLRFRSDPPHAPIADHPCDELTTEDLQEVPDLDMNAYGDDRGRLLAGLIKRSTRAFVLRDDDGVRGYAVVAPSRAGVRIGPWISDDERLAERLLDRVLHDFHDVTVTMGVPELNHAAVAALSSRRFTQTPPCLRMVRGGLIADRCDDRIYAIANGAMG